MWIIPFPLSPSLHSSSSVPLTWQVLKLNRTTSPPAVDKHATSNSARSCSPTTVPLPSSGRKPPAVSEASLTTCRLQVHYSLKGCTCPSSPVWNWIYKHTALHVTRQRIRVNATGTTFEWKAKKQTKETVRLLQLTWPVWGSYSVMEYWEATSSAPVSERTDKHCGEPGAWSSELRRLFSSFKFRILPQGPAGKKNTQRAWVGTQKQQNIQYVRNWNHWCEFNVKVKCILFIWVIIVVIIVKTPEII